VTSPGGEKTKRIKQIGEFGFPSERIIHKYWKNNEENMARLVKGVAKGGK